MSMSIFKPRSKKQQAADASCMQKLDTPNGWGHQVFDKTFLRIRKDKQRDVNNKLEKFSFIRDFQIRYIDGIRLKKPEAEKLCRNCNC